MIDLVELGETMGIAIYAKYNGFSEIQMLKSHADEYMNESGLFVTPDGQNESHYFFNTTKAVEWLESVTSAVTEETK